MHAHLCVGSALRSTQPTRLKHALELLLEARQAPAAIDEVAVAAGPGRVGHGVDVEGELVALLAVGRVGLELGAVGQDYLDTVVVRMEVVELLHGCLARAVVNGPRRHGGQAEKSSP